MALRDFLYPHLEVRLVLARALDVDSAQAAQGTLSTEYQEVAARIIIAPGDAKRLNIKEGGNIEVKSTTGQIVVVARIKESQPEGVAVMHPSPWAFAVIGSIATSQGTIVMIKPSKEPISSIHELP
ncbi:MAG: molybdopterin dinucleotide binding domain-containing protein [Candidatus Hodarchaeota archaeon]